MKMNDPTGKIRPHRQHLAIFPDSIGDNAPPVGEDKSGVSRRTFLNSGVVAAAAVGGLTTGSLVTYVAHKNAAQETSLCLQDLLERGHVIIKHTSKTGEKDVYIFPKAFIALSKTNPEPNFLYSRHIAESFGSELPSGLASDSTVLGHYFKNGGEVPVKIADIRNGNLQELHAIARQADDRRQDLLDTLNRQSNDPQRSR